MSEATVTSNTAQRAGVIAHALRSLAEHIDTHHLDGVGDINVEATHLELSISGCDARVWQASLRDGIDTIDRRAGTEHVDVVTLTGRLPDSGVRVELVWIETAPAGARALRAVTR